MKERVFYVINLDKQRIGVLSLFLFALFFSIFFLGVSVGKGRGEVTKPILPAEGRASVQEVGNDTNQLQPSEQKISESVEPNKEVSSVSVNLTGTNEIPMADVGNSKYYAESSTAKDEEEARKTVVDLTKPKEKVQITSTKTEVKVANITSEKRTLKKQNHAKENSEWKENPVGNLYTIQLGAFSTRTSAEKFLSSVNTENKLSAKSKAFIVVKNGYFVVQMGKTTNKESLNKQLSKLKLPKEVKSKALIVGYSPLS